MRIQGYSKMKTLLSILLIIIGLIIIVLSVTKKTFKIDINRQTPPMTKQEIVLQCEKLSAVATNNQWSYKQCISNLENPNEAKILTI